MNDAPCERQLVVKLTNCSPEWPFLRQTPGRNGVWGNCRFSVNEPLERCDFWVVYEGLPSSETVRCPRGNTLLITAEPPSIKRYNLDFLSQFGHLLTSHRNIVHPSAIYSQQALIWMVGASYDMERKRWSEIFEKDYDELSVMSRPDKDRLLSVIVSGKTITPGHKLRLDFVTRLKKIFGESLDVYGGDGIPLSDKWDGIARYRYHLVLENSMYDDYWTEKLSDAFLGWSFPLYHGCSNIDSYFPAGALQRIDIRDPDNAIALIEKAISDNRCDVDRPAVENARDLVLNRHNLFPMLQRLVRQCGAEGADVETTLHPEKRAGILAKFWRLRNWVVEEGVRRS